MACFAVFKSQWSILACYQLHYQFHEFYKSFSYTVTFRLGFRSAGIRTK